MTPNEESLLRSWHDRHAASLRWRCFQELYTSASNGTRRSSNLNLQGMLHPKHWLALKAAWIHARICADDSYTFGNGHDNLFEYFRNVRNSLSNLLDQGSPNRPFLGTNVPGLAPAEAHDQQDLLLGMLGIPGPREQRPQDMPKAIEVLGENIRQWGSTLVGFEVSSLPLRLPSARPCPHLMRPFSVLQGLEFLFLPLSKFQKRIELYRSTLLELSLALTGRRARSQSAMLSASREVGPLLEEVWSMVHEACSSSVPPFEELRQEFIAVRRSLGERVHDFFPLLVPRHASTEVPCAPDDVVLRIPLGKFELEGRHGSSFATPFLYLVWMPGHFPFVTHHDSPAATRSFPDHEIAMDLWGSQGRDLHPHVGSDGRICFGDSAPAFEVVHRRCCLSVALDMARTALGTYRPGSAYFEFDRREDFGEDGCVCSRCDHYGHVDEFSFSPNDDAYCESCYEAVVVWSEYESRNVYREEAVRVLHGPHEGEWISRGMLDQYLEDHPKPQDEETHEPDAQGEAQAAASVQSPHDPVQAGNQGQAPQATPSEDVPTPDLDPVQFSQRLDELQRLYGPHHQIIIDFVLQALHRGILLEPTQGHAPSPLVGQAAPPADHADAPVHREVVGQAPLPA